MRVTKRDLIAIPVVLVIAIVIITSRGHEKARAVPADEKHRSFYQAIEKGIARKDVEKGCAVCHGSNANPLAEKHPPKEQCLICHQLRHVNHDS